MVEVITAEGTNTFTTAGDVAETRRYLEGPEELHGHAVLPSTRRGVYYQVRSVHIVLPVGADADDVR